MAQPQEMLVVLEIGDAGRLSSVRPDGSDKRVVVTGCRLPDGVVVDVEAGHVYWTNMGNPSVNDGSIERADLDGSGCGIWHMGTRRNPLPLMQQRAYPGLRRTQLDDEYLRELVDQKLKGHDLSLDVLRELEGAEITDKLKPTGDWYNYGYSTTESTNGLQEHGYGN